VFSDVGHTVDAIGMAVGPAGRHFAGMNTRLVLEHVEKRLGAGAVPRVRVRAGDPRELALLRDDSSWSSHDQFLAVLRAAATELGGLDELATIYRDAELVAERGSTVELVALVHALGSPMQLAKTMDSSNHYASMEMQNEDSGEASFLSSYRVRAGFDVSTELCAFMQGLVPLGVRIFGFSDITVTKVSCQCEGDEWCTIEVAWDDTRDLEFLLEEARLLRTVAERRLETFQETTADIVSADDLDVVLDRIVNAASRAITSTAHVLEVAGPGGRPRYYTRGATVEQAREIAARVDDGDPNYLATEVSSATHRYGRLIVVDFGGGAQFERPSLESYARLASSVLESAMALEESRREARTSSALLELASSLAELATGPEVAAKIVAAMPAVLDCDGSAVLLRVDGGLQVAAHHGFDEGLAEAFALPAVDAVVDLLREIKVRTATDMAADSRASMEAQGYVATATAPIVLDGVVSGVLIAGVRHTPERLSEDHNLRGRFTGLAAQASIALRNAWLVDQIRHQSLHDPLTELPNRALIMDRAEQMISRATRHGHPCAALFVDLDGFKDINDTLGHEAGDRVLQTVAERLRATVRDSDTVGRLGGDEFVVLVDGESLDAGVEIVAERLLEVLCAPFEGELGDLAVNVRASIGIAMGSDHSASDLLREADTALYRAKSAGKCCYRIFAREWDDGALQPVSLTGSLVAALVNDEFVLEYQPIFGLGEVRPTGVEALVRWNHPERGILPPVDFVPQLEETGLIIEVGRWVLQEACRQAARWHDGGLLVDVSVNASIRQLERHAFVDEVRDALVEVDLDPCRLIIEITETVIMSDPETTASVLQGLKALGVRIAIDDFGTGYSALAYLRQFPVDGLKIDRSFVAGVTESHASAELVRTLIGLGQALGLETYAEGIERPEQLACLQAMGCQSGQGYYLARPLSGDAAAMFLAERCGVAPAGQTLRR
jgi:diguanylate cyclase (GGDEF)-like protein